MPYKSQKQWKWAFVHKMPWAKKWARETKRPYKRLPRKKRSK
jgi:hypothetical protein